MTEDDDSVDDTGENMTEDDDSVDNTGENMTEDDDSVDDTGENDDQDNDDDQNDDDDDLTQEDSCEEDETDCEVATITLEEETETAGYTFTPIEGTNMVIATRSGQVLSLLFTLPTDEDGNVIPISVELFPELLTPDAFLDAEDWEFQDP